MDSGIWPQAKPLAAHPRPSAGHSHRHRHGRPLGGMVVIMKTFIYNLKPGQRFTRLSDGRKYRFIGKDESLPRGLRYVVAIDDPYITFPDGSRETSFHHLSRVLVEVA
jgi:hypothetical protein